MNQRQNFFAFSPVLLKGAGSSICEVCDMLRLYQWKKQMSFLYLKEMNVTELLRVEVEAV